MGEAELAEVEHRALDPLDLGVEAPAGSRIVGREGAGQVAQRRERGPGLEHPGPRQEALGDERPQVVEPGLGDQEPRHVGGGGAPSGLDLVHQQAHPVEAEPVEQVAAQLDGEVAAARRRRSRRPTAASGRARRRGWRASVRSAAASSSRSVRPVSASRPAIGTTCVHSDRTTGSLW